MEAYQRPAPKSPSRVEETYQRARHLTVHYFNQPGELARILRGARDVEARVFKDDTHVCIAAERTFRSQNKGRTIALTPPAKAALESLLELEGYYPHGLVFRNKSGGQLTEPTLTAYWKEVRARTGSTGTSTPARSTTASTT